MNVCSTSVQFHALNFIILYNIIIHIFYKCEISTSPNTVNKQNSNSQSYTRNRSRNHVGDVHRGVLAAIRDSVAAVDHHMLPAIHTRSPVQRSAMDLRSCAGARPQMFSKIPAAKEHVTMTVSTSRNYVCGCE